MNASLGTAIEDVGNNVSRANGIRWYRRAKKLRDSIIPRQFRGELMKLALKCDAHSPALRFSGGKKPSGIPVPSDRKDVKAVGRAVDTICAGDPSPIIRATPPRAGHRHQDMVMMLSSRPEIIVLGRMRVTGNAQYRWVYPCFAGEIMPTLIPPRAPLPEGVGQRGNGLFALVSGMVIGAMTVLFWES